VVEEDLVVKVEQNGKLVVMKEGRRSRGNVDYVMNLVTREQSVR